MRENLSREETLELAQAASHRCINGEITLAVLSVELMKLRGLDAEERNTILGGAAAARSTDASRTHEAKRYAASMAWLQDYLARNRTRGNKTR